MATNFGGESCTYINDPSVIPLCTRLKTWVVPGLNGIGALDMAANESGFRFRLIIIDTNANVNTWIDNIAALKGTVVSCEDSFEDTYSNLLFEEMTAPEKTAVLDDGVLKVIGEITVTGKVIA